MLFAVMRLTQSLRFGFVHKLNLGWSLTAPFSIEDFMTINQEKLNAHGQVEYLGRWVDKKFFRAFVYSLTDQKLAKSYEEFKNLVGSGLWFISKEDAQKSVESEVKPDAEVKIFTQYAKKKSKVDLSPPQSEGK